MVERRERCCQTGHMVRRVHYGRFTKCFGEFCYLISYLMSVYMRGERALQLLEGSLNEKAQLGSRGVVVIIFFLKLMIS